MGKKNDLDTHYKKSKKNVIKQLTEAKAASQKAKKKLKGIEEPVAYPTPPAVSTHSYGYASDWKLVPEYKLQKSYTLSYTYSTSVFVNTAEPPSTSNKVYYYGGNYHRRDSAFLISPEPNPTIYIGS